MSAEMKIGVPDGSGGWQVGEEPVLVARLTDPVSGRPIEAAGTEVVVKGLKGDGSTFEATVVNPTDGLYEAPLDLDVAGVWKGHLIATGAYKLKRPFRIAVGND